MFKKSLMAASIACAVASSAGAFGATITNNDGVFTNWNGFDWQPNGTALISGFNNTAATDNFDLTYWATAASLTKVGGGNFANFQQVNLNNPISPLGYEYT